MLIKFLLTYLLDCRNTINPNCIFHSTCTVGKALVILFCKVDYHFGGLDYGLVYALCYYCSKLLTLFHWGTFSSVSWLIATNEFPRTVPCSVS